MFGLDTTPAAGPGAVVDGADVLAIYRSGHSGSGQHVDEQAGLERRDGKSAAAPPLLRKRLGVKRCRHRRHGVGPFQAPRGDQESRGRDRSSRCPQAASSPAELTGDRDGASMRRPPSPSHRAARFAPAGNTRHASARHPARTASAPLNADTRAHRARRGARPHVAQCICANRSPCKACDICFLAFDGRRCTSPPDRLCDSSSAHRMSLVGRIREVDSSASGHSDLCPGRRPVNVRITT